jgi:hypothetical protein
VLPDLLGLQALLVLLELLVKWVRGALGVLPESLVRRVVQDTEEQRDPQAMLGQLGQLAALGNKALEVPRVHLGRPARPETPVPLGQKAIKGPLVMKAQWELKAT